VEDISCQNGVECFVLSAHQVKQWRRGRNAKENNFSSPYFSQSFNF
jgi:hypothetical protein